MLYTKTKTISTTAHVVKIKKQTTIIIFLFLKKSSFFIFTALFLLQEREQESNNSQRFFKFKQIIVFLYSVNNRAKVFKYFLPVREGYSPCACHSKRQAWLRKTPYH